MKKLIIVISLLVAASFTKSYAQNMVFMAYAKAEDSLMRKDYYSKNITDFRKNLDEFVAKYQDLSERDKILYKSFLDGDYYNLACTYALLKDKKNALDYLEKSKYYDYDHLLEDSDLDIIRKEPRFKKFLMVAKTKRIDYVAILRKAAKYNTDAKSEVPAFTYEPATDANMRLLKKTYNLDSIAGMGNDVTRIINLMHWVHNLIPHDGSKGNPDIKNALSMISVCKKDNKTLNCRGLAIVLNEVYLADGFKSRYVTCLPKDKLDQDCHVITMVWSTSLKKWLWMDPTFNAYVMNEKGELLSIEEVRERLVSNKPLILNPDADHNHESSQTKKDYLETYMAKNLYKLECPVNSEYNYESYESGKKIAYIALLPATEFAEQQNGKQVNTLLFKTYYSISNPKLFWQEPAGQPVIAYEKVLNQFKTFYNQNQADSIANLFSDSWGEAKKTIWTADQQNMLVEKYGTLKSFSFLGVEPEDGVLLFKTEFTKSTHATGISIDDDGKIMTFRFKTSSPYINDLLAKAK